jgi:hypothetical protein
MKLKKKIENFQNGPKFESFKLSDDEVKSLTNDHLTIILKKSDFFKKTFLLIYGQLLSSEQKKFIAKNY